MLPFWLQLLESLNFSIFGPHVKLQPTSNESLIKQTKNSMCDRCEFAPGQDVGMETRRLDTTELKVLTKSWCPSPKGKQHILCLQKRINSSSETQKYRDQVTRFWACPSCLRICHSSFNCCIHSPSQEKRNGEFSGIAKKYFGPKEAKGQSSFSFQDYSSFSEALVALEVGFLEQLRFLGFCKQLELSGEWSEGSWEEAQLGILPNHVCTTCNSSIHMLARRSSQPWGDGKSCHSRKNHQPALAEKDVLVLREGVRASS